jgi:hypothetical protein
MVSDIQLGDRLLIEVLGVFLKIISSKIWEKEE